MEKSAEAIRGHLAVADRLEIEVGEERISVSDWFAHPESDPILCILPGDSAAAEHLHANPHRVRFSVQAGPGGALEASGRAITIGPVAEHADLLPDVPAQTGTPSVTDSDDDRILVKLVPERYRLLDPGSSTEIWEYITETGRDRPPQRALWVRAMRFFSLSFTVLAGLIGAGFALGYSGAVRWELLPLILLGAFALHVGTNLTSEYFDYMENVDRPETQGGTGVLVEGLLAPRAVLRAGLIAFGLGVAIGAYITYRVDWWILFFGVVGFLGGYFYGAGPLRLKYRALGELAVFICFGPFMVVGTYYALTGHVDWSVALAAIPIGFLITAVLEANNTRDILHDGQARVQTLPIRFGVDAARRAYAILVLAAYLVTGVLVASGMIPVIATLVFLTLPVAVKNVRDMLAVEGEGSPILGTMDVRTAQLVTQFGVLFAAALLVDRLL